VCCMYVCIYIYIYIYMCVVCVCVCTCEREKERAAITHAERGETPPHVEGSRATDAPGRHVGQVGIRRRHLPLPRARRQLQSVERGGSAHA